MFSKKWTGPVFPEILDRLDAGSRRFRGGSVGGSEHQEAVLDEVFRRPYKGSMAVRASKTDVRSIETGGEAVDSWMKGVVSPTGSLTTDIEGGFAIRRRALARGRRGLRRRDSYGTIGGVLPGGHHTKYFTDASRSVISDPEDFVTKTECRHPLEARETLAETMTEGDADNEENSGEEEEMNEDTENPEAGDALPEAERLPSPQKTLTPPRPRSLEFPKHSVPIRPRKHFRTNTSTTILYTQPTVQSSDDEFTVGKIQAVSMSRRASERLSIPGENSSGKKTPRSSRPQTASRPRPIPPTRKTLQPVQNLDGPNLMNGHEERRRNSETMEDLAHQDNIAMIPSSFATQMAIAIGARGGVGDDMLGRLVLARVSALEEGMKDVKDILREVKKLSAKSKAKEKEKERESQARKGKESMSDKEEERGRERHRGGEVEKYSEGALEDSKGREQGGTTSSWKE